MASPEVLDFTTLLAPVPGDNPAGADLRAAAAPAYYAVKDARTKARAVERQLLSGEDDADVAPPDWRPVFQEALPVLAEQSKDLEIAAYLVEALVRLQGFAGLRDGFRLARELVEHFWDNLYPLPDEDGMETRVAPLTGLNGADAEGTLIAPINNVPLTRGGSVGPYAHHHYLQATAVGQLADEEARQRRLQQGAVSLPMFEQAVAETSGEFFTELVEDLTACQEEYARLCLALDDKCGSATPPSSNIRSALAGCLEVVRNLARDKLAVATPQEEEAPAADGEAAAAPAGDGAAGPLRSREDAFRMLLKVADFFRRTEPHTPVSYALEQAVRWGRMALPELLTELIPDETARQQFFRQVGIRDQAPPPM